MKLSGQQVAFKNTFNKAILFFMQNFKLTIEYDGATFKGWQRQAKGERTVQGELERVLCSIFKVEQITTIASGRTDSGVHALGQVVSVKAQTKMTPQQLRDALNAWLPKDIAVIAVKRVALDFHAQYHVKQKTYRYSILNREYPSALLRERVLYFPYELDIKSMKEAVKVLVGKHDFKSFQAHDPLRADKQTVRTISKIQIRKKGALIEIDVTADGFLYKMVRNIVGALIAVGRGKMAKKELITLLNAKDRTKGPATVAASGLALLKVVY